MLLKSSPILSPKVVVFVAVTLIARWGAARHVRARDFQTWLRDEQQDGVTVTRIPGGLRSLSRRSPSRPYQDCLVARCLRASFVFDLTLPPAHGANSRLAVGLGQLLSWRCLRQHFAIRPVTTLDQLPFGDLPDRIPVRIWCRSRLSLGKKMGRNNHSHTPEISIVCVFNNPKVGQDCLDRSSARTQVRSISTTLRWTIEVHTFTSAGAALNHGARQARHELVAFAHQDVYLHSIDRLAIAGSAFLGGTWGLLGANGVTSQGESVGRLRDRAQLIGRHAPTPVEADRVEMREVLFMVPREQLLRHPLTEDTISRGTRMQSSTVFVYDA